MAWMRAIDVWFVHLEADQLRAGLLADVLALYGLAGQAVG
jgi:hypothetical protein